MNRRMVFFTVGQMVVIEAVLLLLPLAVSIIYGESAAITAFAVTAAIACVAGALLMAVCRTKNKVIYAKEGFVIVALTWVVVSLIGAVPFVLSRDIPSYVDAFFETVSGLTTTGSSILTNVEALSHGALFWRSFSHWLGGMGVLVFIMAIVPNVSDRSIHIIRAEMPGPIVGKLVPKVKDTAKLLYLIYVVLTLVETVLLMAGGMNLFEGLVHSFGTAGTGGFGIKSTGIGGYSPYIQWVITVFMILFGVNFNLYYLLLIRKFRTVAKNRELWTYLSVIAVSVILISVNIYHIYGNVADTLRMSAFQVSAIVTTTGYSTCDFNLWPGFSRSLLFILMFVGGCAGSTAGGLKISRVMLLFKMAKNEFLHLIHPRSVSVVKLEGKQVEAPVLHSVSNYFTLYVICMCVAFALISLFDPMDLETNITATVTCFNNVGPGLGKLVGPAGNFSAYSGASKIVLSFAMLFGRLEILPLMIAFIPSTWTKR
ncbi:MAG: TrkH family potassium uptake protein [Clostridia bacterium]|nr:TrkH family potassium uptake protein [Clostridia bacterium]